MLAANWCQRAFMLAYYLAFATDVPKEDTMTYPRILIDQEAVLTNAAALKKMGEQQRIQITPVVKALAGYDQLIRAIAELGFTRIGDSSLRHIRNYADLAVEKWLLRSPMICEMPQLIELTDGALISEERLLREIEAEAGRQNTSYKVMLMAELGDLREGCDQQELVQLAILAESLPHVQLEGIGANLSCYGNILPGVKNMAAMADMAAAVETAIGRQLAVVSGGNSSSLKMLAAGQLPAAITDLRCGESLLLGMIPCYDVPADWLRQGAFTVETEIIEIKTKPSLPWGESGSCDSFGGTTSFEDKGLRKRALAALGKQEIYINGLTPCDHGVELLGGSSNYLVCDITDGPDYQVGDTIAFYCDYAAMATGMCSAYIEKRFL